MKSITNFLIDRERRDLSRAAFLLLVFGLLAFRLLLASQGAMFLEPENSPIDDQLMYNAAVSITEGNWLGEYQYNTIAKHMFFSVWLAFVHWTGAPYLIANAALACAGAWIMACALWPLLKKRGWVLAAFCLLAYCPAGFDQYNYRVYRDSITVSLLLLAFGGVIGCVLHAFPAAQETVPSRKRRVIAFWGYSIVGGLGLGASWLNREDGVWLLPFVICFLLLGTVAVLKARGLRGSLKTLLGFCLPFVLMGGCLAAYAGMNLKHYDRFILSDLTSRDFTTAYGLLTGIEDEGTGACRPTTYATRQKLYQNSEFFATLEPYWDSPNALNGYGNPQTHEYGGSFYYGLRLAGQFAGQYTDPLETKAYYEAIAAELLRLEAEGVIAITHPTRSTVPYWRWEYFSPTLQELGSGLTMALFCEDFEPRPRLSVYSKEDLVAEMLDYLNDDIVRGYMAGTDLPYHHPIANLSAHAACWLWRILILPAVACGLWFAFAYWKKGFRYLFSESNTPEPAFFVWVLLWGLLLSAVLRCGLMAYMEGTAFRIGTYLMYQSTAVPLLGLFGLLGVHEAICAPRRRKRAEKEQNT